MLRKYHFDVAVAPEIPVSYIDFYTSGGIGHILGIYIDKENRFTDTGSELVKHALKVLEKSGCHKAKAIVYSYNSPALSFFRSNSFKESTTFFDDEFHRDVVIMIRFIL